MPSDSYFDYLVRWEEKMKNFEKIIIFQKKNNKNRLNQTTSGCSGRGECIFFDAYGSEREKRQTDFQKKFSQKKYPTFPEKNTFFLKILKFWKNVGFFHGEPSSQNKSFIFYFCFLVIYAISAFVYTQER